jgi:coatomer protein complex subunit alpha (xenin)
MTTLGKFQPAVDSFRHILLRIPFLYLKSRAELAEARELVTICREYLTGLSIEMQRKELSKQTHAQPTRVAEMAAYFSHCNLQVFTYNYFFLHDLKYSITIKPRK